MTENRIISLYGAEETPKAKNEKPVSILSPPGLVSILIPCCGQLEYTKLCVPSVIRHSRTPFEIIFIDIGSLDGTSEYLAGVRAAVQGRIEVIHTHTDVGIPEACRSALAAARGEYLVLLNNDTIVTDAWLNQLIGLSSVSPALGMVGPMSNYAAPPQLVESVPYRIGPRKSTRATAIPTPQNVLVEVQNLDAFAQEWREKHRSKWVEAERLGGFCLLMKRAVLDKIGPLDEWTDLGLFDTDILSAKARQAGFMLACCRDLYIHHFGTRTFAHGAAPSAVAEQKPK
jgi:GT2 family glycosyltransferase